MGRRRRVHPLDLPVVRPESLRNRTGKRPAIRPEDYEVRPPSEQERGWADGVADRAKDSDFLTLLTPQALAAYKDALEAGVITEHALLSNLALDAVAMAEHLPLAFDYSAEMQARIETATDLWAERYLRAHKEHPERCPTCHRPWSIDGDAAETVLVD